MSSNEGYATLLNENKVKLIAFYLPQFHPIPENNKWWGNGFTEWTNVTKAKPLFAGHYQPHLPADLGFYDLRLKETRHEQIKLARQYGIDGFCYHYYWFSGQRLLNRPIDDMYADHESEMPYCFCWANENWTRRWDGAESEVLIAQENNHDDDLNFIKEMIKYFQDPRYIKVEGAPILIVYIPQNLKDSKKTIRIWRDYCKSAGIDKIHLCAALTFGNYNYLQYGFDSGVEFPPHNVGSQDNKARAITFYEPFQGIVIQYASIANTYLKRIYGDAQVFKTVFPSWDNTARTENRALVVLNGDPDNYEYWLASTIDHVHQSGQRNPIVFINAWNEWAEGCHLEPDRLFGHGYLHATLNAKSGLRRFTDFKKKGLPLVDEKHSRTFWKDIAKTFRYHFLLNLGSLKLAVNRRPWLRRILLPLVRKVRELRTSDSLQIIILQQGKVGSLSIKNSLEYAYRQLSYPAVIHHVHALNNLDQREAYIKSTRENPEQSIRQIQNWRRLRKEIDSYPKRKWKIINLVRDPVAIKVSALFQTLNEHIPDWQKYLKNGELTMNDLEKLFYSKPEFGVNDLDTWHDEQIKALWGIDIFAIPFHKDKGYQIYRRANIDLLVIRLEDLNRIANRAIDEFLGIKNLIIQSINVANDKPYARLYDEFKTHPLSEKYVDKAYKLRFANHFYTADEIAAFRKHWLKQ